MKSFLLSTRRVFVAIAILVVVLFAENTYAQSNHTISFSGSSTNFYAAEKISAAANNTDYYVTFDATNLYIGAFRTSGSFGTVDNLTIYLDTDPNATPTSGSGTSSGQSYNGVTGSLPFSANYNVHAEESYQEARSDASSWASTISGLSYHTGSTWREVAIPLSSIGNPDALYISMWMGYAGGIYSNAPGADLGSGANPTVANYIGGIGLSSADCIPVNTLNTPITASITNAVPVAGAVYGKVTINSAAITATNNFNIASGGSITISGGSFDISGRAIVLGGSVGDGNGTTVNYTGGTFTSNSSTMLTFNGEGLLAGSNNTFDGSIIINRKFTPLAAGGTTLGSAASIDLRSGSYVDANPITYSNGSTLKYNTGSVYVASTGWTAGATFGAGVPSNVVIGDAVANSVLSFGISASYRHANGNITISNSTAGNGLTLSSVAGGDLSLNGNFVQNGSFTHNGRTVTFSGSGAQAISGNLNTTGATNNFRFFIASNTGSGITFNSNTLFSGSSGNVMQLTDGNLNIASGVTVTVEGGGGAIQVSNGTRTINFNAATSSMVFTGSKTISSTASGLLRFTSTSANGTLSLAGSLNFGNLLTTIGTNTYLEIVSGGSVNTNAPNYAAGSTLVYNSGGSYGASTEWSTNTTSGSGVPSNVLIGNSTSLNFGTSTLFRHANRNVTISSGSTLVLSTVAGGDLQLRGDFAQNGTFTHNSRTVTFTGSSAQSITGSLNTAGASNNFAYLVAANSSGGLNLNTNVMVSQTSGDVLVLSGNGALNIVAGQTLTIAGIGGNIRVNGASRTINFNATSSVLNISNSKTVTSTSSGLLSFTSSVANGNLRIAAAVDFGASLTTIGNNTYLQIDAGGSILTNAPTYATGSTLVYNTGGTFTASTGWTTNATTGIGVPHHILIGNGVNTTLSFGASNQFRHAKGNVTTAASSALTLSSAADGNLQLAGNFVNNGTFTHSLRDVTFIGTAAQQITGATTFNNLILNNSNGLSLNSPTTVSNILTLTLGSLSLGASDLTLSNTATGAITGTFSSSRMIIIDGAGQLVRSIATAGLPITYTFPVGEITGITEYSPASFIISANGAARNIGVRVLNANHPQLNNTPSQTDYISRYWLTSNSAASTYTYTANFTYTAADLNGAESNVRANMWNGSSWSHVATSSSTSNVLSITNSVTNTTLPLGATAEFTGRVNNGATYVWNQTGTASFATATNWTPNRMTAAVNDILVFNNGATTVANGVTTQTIGQLLVTGNTNVSLVSAVNATLTIVGGNGTDLNVASGSTLQLASTLANALVINFTNATTASIDGTLTIINNTALDNQLNCANSVVTVNGSINNFGIVNGTVPTLVFGSTGVYRHNFTTTAGVLPIANWNVASTCLIQGYTSNGTAPSNLNQTFGGFTWNCAGQTAMMQFNGALTNVAGNFNVLRTGLSSELRLAHGGTQTMTVGGSMTVSGASTKLTLSFFNNGKNTIFLAGSYTQNSATSVVELGAGNAGTLGKIYVGGNFNFSAGTIQQSAAATTGGIALIEFNGTSAQTIIIGGTFVNTIDFGFDNTTGFTLTGSVPINQNGSLYRRAGALSGGTMTYNATGTSLYYEGTTAMTTAVEFPATNGPVNVSVNTTNVIYLSGSRTLPSGGIFTSINGIFSLGNFDITLNNTAAGAHVNASPGVSNMIAADGAGQLKRALPNSARDLQFYIGDVTGASEYSAIRLNFSTNSVANRIVGVRVVDANSPNLNIPFAPIDFTSRYWVITLSSTAGTYTYTPTLTYDVAGDVNGTENNFQLAAFASAASAWNHYTTTITSPSLISTVALTQANFDLNNAQFSGRTPVKYWNGSVSADWNTAANWSPSGVPTSVDNLDINTATPNVCTLSSGSVTINHLTMNQTGVLNMSSGTSLTVAGNLTFVNTASVNFNCNSTFSLTNTTFNQKVPALQYGHLNLGSGARTLDNSGTIRICGNYTPTSGALTSTGSTVEFNGTSVQSILSNNTGFNNLFISNASATVTSPTNVTVGGSLQINTNARLNNTTGSLTINSGATANVDGYLRNSGTIITTGTVTISGTGTYEHNVSGAPGTIPVATWASGSMCDLIGNFSSGNINFGLQNFHHVRASFTGSGAVNANRTLTNMGGDLSIVSTGTGTFALSGNLSTNMTIGGSINQSGGSWMLATGSNSSFYVNLAGNFIQTSGAFDMMQTTGSGAAAEINILGNYSRTGNGIIIASGGGSQDGIFRFNGVNQTILETATGLNQYIDYYINNGTTTLLSNLAILGSSSTFTATVTVANGATLDVGNYVISGSPNTRTNVMSGGTIRTANANGLTASGASGSVQTVSRIYNSGATFEYNGTTNQNTGNFWTITSPTVNTVGGLTINNTGTAGNNTVTMNSVTTANVSSLLSFPATNLGALDVQSNTVSVNNNNVNAVSRLGLGHVIGNLRRNIATGSNSYRFDVGTAGAYSPMTVDYNTVTLGGYAIVMANAGAHPNAATDGLSQTAYLNRWWNVVNSGITSTGSANINTFSYPSSDLIGGAISSSLQLVRWNGAVWSYPSFSTAINQISGTTLSNTTTYGQFIAADCGSLVVNVTPSSTMFCNGGSVGLTATTNFGAPTFSWSPATGLSATTGASVTASPSTTTTYTVIATTAQNCTASKTTTITIIPRPTSVISGSTTYCNGGSATLAVALTGTGPWSGTLSNGVAFSGSVSPITVVVSPSTTTTYTVSSLSDANCTSIASDRTGGATISMNVRPTGNLAGTQTICVGSSAPLSIAVTGSGTISGTLSPGAIPFSGTAPSINLSLSPSSNITYTVISLSDANCSAIGADITGSAIITVTATPTASISGTTSVCAGSTSNISFTGTANATVTYTINAGANQTINLDGSGNATLNSGSVFTNKTYALVSVSNGVCSIAVSGSAVLTKVDYPEADIAGTASICSGASTTISFEGNPGAIVTYTINGGSNQFITLNGSGIGSVNTGALTSNITYLLVSVSNGICSQAIGSVAEVTVYLNTYYRDLDSDGFGDPTVTTTGCTPPVGYVVDNTDCCDSNADINPGTEWWVDLDGDGYGSFVFDSGCLSGVTCASGTWPTQTIPYYPAAHGGASYASDCNDSNIAVRPGAIEICSNNIDENCNGLIDEGCAGPVNDNFNNAILVNLNNPNAIYPNCLVYTGTMVNATVSTQGNVSNVALGGGRDVWYKFVAPSTAVQVKVSPTSFDAVVELKSSAATQIDAENVNTVVGGLEILNYGNLIAGQTYWLAVRNYNTGNTGNFNICVSPLMASSCAYTVPAGGFPLCNSYKAVYRGADSYTFNFTGTGGSAAFPYVTTSGTSTGFIPLSTPSLDLRYGGIYSVRVDANFNVVNGLGASNGSISVLGSIASSNCTGVSIIAQPLLEVKSALRCPATMTRSQYLIGTPVSGSGNACSAISYTFEFTQVTNCSGTTTIGLPFEVTSPANTPYLILGAAFPIPTYPLANNGYWKVRIRPVFMANHGAYGPAQTIQVSGTSASAMLSEEGMIGAEKSVVEEMKSGVYPNPNKGEWLNINLTGIGEGNVYIRVMDAVGRIVYSDMQYAEHSLYKTITFNDPLHAGIYLVEFTVNGKTTTEKLLIER